MRNSGINSDVQQQQQKNLQGRVNGNSINNNGFLPSSFRAISSYLRIVSSGASTVARSAASAAQSIVDRDDDANHDQGKSGTGVFFLSEEEMVDG
ncbi:AUTOPHAGY-RELATED PROTEIN 18F [Salix koriyanagi]|uniref:AUTOPHAGY-RELATED PROTEIN 18F n=1 Tax=Salix koriyanagi TaxID=2511006 RepID=A0A9Q0ZB72_9ROSI|nr:AUTOPHAGY-RELATED PROTEIN 18F [Salix koriyanagi]